MSLASRISDFATRVASEFVTVRTEIPVIIPTDQTTMDTVLAGETWVTDAIYIVFEE